MRPRGDGEREISRKASGSLDLGERKSLEALPSTDGGEAGLIGFDRRLGRRCRAEFEGVDSGPCPSSGSSERCCRRDADRVVGVRYPSRASDLSEREGDGGMTRGIAGTVLGEEGISDALTANGGRVGAQM